MNSLIPRHACLSRLPRDKSSAGWFFESDLRHGGLQCRGSAPAQALLLRNVYTKANGTITSSVHHG